MEELDLQQIINEIEEDQSKKQDLTENLVTTDVAKKESVVLAVGNDTLKADNSPFSLKLRRETFHSEKEFDKFIKCVERLVRYSQEYKEWVSYIVETLGQDRCALTDELIGECKVEIHHHPINLYTICKSLVTEKMAKGHTFCSYDIATAVIELHFNNKIGYIPILGDLHEKYHNGFLTLPIELVHGDYLHILKTFKLDDNEHDRIIELCNIHVKDCKVNWKKGVYPGIENFSEDNK